MKKFLLGAAAAVAIAGSAQAADISGGNAFDGFYVGAAGGYAFGEIGDLSIKGPAAGGFFGYGAVFSGTYFAGIEGALDYSWQKNTVSGIDVTRDVVGAATLRVGYLASQDVLFYAQGGYVRSRVKVDAGAGLKDDAWFDGVRAGLGAEQSYGGGLFGRVAVDADFMEQKQKSGSAKLGLGYRF